MTLNKLRHSNKQRSTQHNFMALISDENRGYKG